MLIKEAIDASGGNARQLAKEVGVTRSALWRWAENHREPRPENMHRLVQVLRRRVARLNDVIARLEKRTG